MQEPTAPSSPRAIAGTPSALRAERVEAEAARAAGRKRTLAYAVAAALAVGRSRAVVVPLARRHAPAADSRDEPRAAVDPVVRPAEADSPLDRAAPRDRPLVAPVAGDVRVTSEPAGAQVFVGPKLVGIAPMTLHLGTRRAEPVTLVHPGYEDLNYTVQPGDAPSLTLRMLRRHAPKPSPARARRRRRVQGQGRAQDPRRHLRRRRQAARAESAAHR